MLYRGTHRQKKPLRQRLLTRSAVATGIVAVVGAAGGLSGFDSATAAPAGPVAAVTVPVDLVGGAYTVTVERDINDPVTLAAGSIASPVLTVPLTEISLTPGQYIVDFVATHLIDAGDARIVVGSEGVDAATLAAPGTITFTPGAEQTTAAYPSPQALLAANTVGQRTPSCSVCSRQVLTATRNVSMLAAPAPQGAGDQCGSAAVAPTVALMCAEQLFSVAAETITTAYQSDAGVSVPIPTIVGETSIPNSVFDSVNQALQMAGDCVAQTDPTCAAIVKDLELKERQIADFVDQLETDALQEAEDCATQSDPTCALVVQTAEQEAQALEATITACVSGASATCAQLEQLAIAEVTALVNLATACVSGTDSNCTGPLGTATQLAGEAVNCATGTVNSTAPVPEVTTPTCDQLEATALNALDVVPSSGICTHQPSDGTGTYCEDPCPAIENGQATADSQTPFDCQVQHFEQDGIPALRGMADRVAGETTTFSLDKSEQSQWDIEYRAGVGPFSVSGHNSSTDTFDQGDTWPVMGDCWTGEPPAGQHTPAPTGDYCAPDGASEMTGQDAWQWERHFNCQNEGIAGPYYCTDYETEHQIAFDGGTDYGNTGIMSGYYADPLAVKAGQEGQWASYLPGSVTYARLGKQHYYSVAVNFYFDMGSNYGGANFTAGMSQQNNLTVTNYMQFRPTSQVAWNYKFYHYDIGDSPFGKSRWTSEMASGYLRPSGTTSNYPWPYGT